MSSLIDFFNNQAGDSGLSHKNNLIKRNIIAYMATNGEVTLAELTKELKISIPTMTKLVQELVDEDIVSDLGKVETQGGRRPNVFGLTCSTLYFAGVHVGRDRMTCVLPICRTTLYMSGCLMISSWSIGNSVSIRYAKMLSAS